MDKIPILEKFSVFMRNLVKEVIQFSYYILWLVIDPRKFAVIRKSKIKNILVVSGGAIGDIYNIIGIMNSFEEKNDVNLYFLTLEKNRKFVKNPRIKTTNLSEAKRMIDKREIDAAILIDPAREREIFDRTFFIKTLKIPYVVSTDAFKLNPSSIKKNFPILANRKVFPVNANGPGSYIRLFNLLPFKVKKPEFYYTKEGEKFANSFYKKNADKDEKVVIIHPCSAKIVSAIKEGNTPAHLWPVERWAELIGKIVKDKKFKVVITGVKDEAEITDKIYALIKNKKEVVYAVGKVPDIESLASIVKRANCVITLDTSMSHISAQAGTPEVVIYSSHSPKIVSPLTNNRIDIYHKDKAHDCRKYACEYCHNVHMKSISVDEIYSAAMKLIS